MTRREAIAEFDAAAVQLGDGFAWLGDDALERAHLAWVRAGRPAGAVVDAELVGSSGEVRVTVSEGLL